MNRFALSYEFLIQDFELAIFQSPGKIKDIEILTL